MKAIVVVNPTRTTDASRHLLAMIEGLRRHGIEVTHNRHDETADFAVCWSWRTGERLRREGVKAPILVMERGYLGDRFKWTSLGWDGLNGRARFPKAQDGGERFWRNFGNLACEWEQHDGYALVIGQVPGDMALKGADFQSWVAETIDALDRKDIDVRFRHHPEALRRGHTFRVPDYMVLGGTLEQAFSEAGFVVTFNSNTGVEAVLAGIPTIAVDEGAMAWPVTSHSLHAPLVMPDRSEWFRGMAWRQWSMDEIASGFAWEIVRKAM